MATDGRFAYDISAESLDRPQSGATFLNGTLYEGTTAVTGYSIRESFYCAGGVDLILALFELPFVHTDERRMQTLETNEELQKYIGRHTGMLLTFLAEILLLNPSLQREMNHTATFSTIHVLMKRYAPFNL